MKSWKLNGCGVKETLANPCRNPKYNSMKQDECFVKRTIPVSPYYSPKRILCEAGQSPLCMKLDSVVQGFIELFAPGG